MPKGTKVESLYQKLKGKGKSEASAAKIAQSATGLALATGKPPKTNLDMSKLVKKKKSGG
jgi:hypothetical protein